MVKQIVKYESGKYFVRYATELTELAGRQKLVAECTTEI